MCQVQNIYVCKKALQFLVNSCPLTCRYTQTNSVFNVVCSYRQLLPFTSNLIKSIGMIKNTYTKIFQCLRWDTYIIMFACIQWPSAIATKFRKSSCRHYNRNIKNHYFVTIFNALKEAFANPLEYGLVFLFSYEKQHWILDFLKNSKFRN